MSPPDSADPAPDDDATRVVAGDSGLGALLPAAAPKAPPTQGPAPQSAAGTPTGGRRAATLPGEAPVRGETLPGAAAGSAAAGNVVREVGRYRIESRLGRGGMASVYRAHDPQIGRDVAIKFLHASLCEDPEYRARFLREARAAGGLAHPNIVVVHDVGEIDGRPYLAMELLTGESLAEVLERDKQLPLRDAVVTGIQLARALDYAHAKGIVHRDIKPGNIMRMAGSRTVKVTDFGIAHMDDGQADTQRTRVGDVLGTPQYMSPEQAQGEKLDGRSDLFSAGIVLYQMLAGARPFTGDSLVALAVKIANQEPAPIETLRPDVPPALRRVVARCLAKSPAQRFQTGKELAEALTKVLAEMDAAAAEKARPRIVPLRVKWALAMACIVAAVMGVTTFVIMQRQQAEMMRQVSGYGATLARFLAAQNAAAALGEDWPAIEVAVQEIMRTRDFEGLAVVDATGVVRASSVPSQVGQRYKAAGTESLGSNGRVAISRYMAGGESIIGFETPMTFQDRDVGRVALGVAERPLTQMARLAAAMMGVLALVTVLAVAVAMYFLVNWFEKPIRLVGDALGEIAKGRFDHRIGEKRSDEFGQLYTSFDAMAAALQRRDAGGGGAEPSTLGPPRTPPDGTA